jgi:hypothetical protein
MIASVDHFTTKYKARQSKRELLLKSAIGTYESNELSKNLGLAPGEVKMTAYNNDGSAVNNFKESSFSARPVCPYPFLKESLLREDQIHRIHQVWNSTRNLKTQRNNDDDNDQKLCSVCNDFVSEDRIVCPQCDITVHTLCYQDVNSEWSLISEISDDLICKECNVKFR